MPDYDDFDFEIPAEALCEMIQAELRREYEEMREEDRGEC